MYADYPRVLLNMLSWEELPDCTLPLDKGVVSYPDSKQFVGWVLFMEVGVRTRDLGDYTVPVIYAFVENEAFCARRLLPAKARISHMIHVSYGGGFGGGKCSGKWMLNVMERLQCECLLSDGLYGAQKGDDLVYELYPELSGAHREDHFRSVRMVSGSRWSAGRDVHWNVPQAMQ